MFTKTEYRAALDRIETKTRNAYSYDRYGSAEWRRAIRLLLDRGYNDRGIEGILRSKLTRWAADSMPAGHRVPRGEDLINYIDDPRNKVSAATVTRLAQETFNDNGTDIGTPTFAKQLTGYDLAEFAEGEEVGELIDLARALVDKNGILSSKAARILARIDDRRRAAEGQVRTPAQLIEDRGRPRMTRAEFRGLLVSIQRRAKTDGHVIESVRDLWHATGGSTLLDAKRAIDRLIRIPDLKEIV